MPMHKCETQSLSVRCMVMGLGIKMVWVGSSSSSSSLGPLSLCPGCTSALGLLCSGFQLTL
jgi:hypothetical protein